MSNCDQLWVEFLIWSESVRELLSECVSNRAHASTRNCGLLGIVPSETPHSQVHSVALFGRTVDRSFHDYQPSVLLSSRPLFSSFVDFRNFVSSRGSKWYWSHSKCIVHNGLSEKQKDQSRQQVIDRRLRAPVPPTFELLILNATLSSVCLSQPVFAHLGINNQSGWHPLDRHATPISHLAPDGWFVTVKVTEESVF